MSKNLIEMNETKICPYCGEEIMAAAKKCRFCGEWLETEGRSNPQREETAKRLETEGQSGLQREEVAKRLETTGQLGSMENGTRPDFKPQQVEQTYPVQNEFVGQAQNVQAQPVPTIIINQQPVRQPREEVKRNGMGTAGFVMSLVGLFVSWIPVLGWIIWGLGLIFSFVGVFKTPRSLAIAGLVVSVFGLILLIVISSALSEAASEIMDWFDY